MAGEIGCIGVVADVKGEAVAFYEKVGFEALRISAGELGERCLSVNGECLYSGDRVLFTRNSRLYGVKNGSRRLNCLWTLRGRRLTRLGVS